MDSVKCIFVSILLKSKFWTKSATNSFYVPTVFAAFGKEVLDPNGPKIRNIWQCLPVGNFGILSFVVVVFAVCSAPVAYTSACRGLEYT